MEAKLKERSKGNGLFGRIKNIEAFYQKVTKKISMKAPEVANLSYAPYETSEGHKAHIAEVELRRSQALAEAQRQNLRGR